MTMEAVKNHPAALKDRIRAVPYWYHRIELPGGVVTPGWAPLDPAAYRLPADLTGMRVLDVGAWDGYWSFECLRRGAREVVAIDDFSDGLGGPAADALIESRRRLGWVPFDLCAEALGYGPPRLKRQEMSVYEVLEGGLGRFDLILFFGTYYHLRHPLLALERLAEISAGDIYLESAILDDYSVYHGGLANGYPGGQGVMEFYPEDQYGANPTCWWVPTLACLAAQCDAAGWPYVDCWKLEERPADLAHCRGFVHASKHPFPEAMSDGPADVKAAPAPKPTAAPSARPAHLPLALTTRAVMTMPRLTHTDNFVCATRAMQECGIAMNVTTGAFWDQCLESAMEEALATGADALLTLDYDTVFAPADVRELVRLLAVHPEAAAVAALQMRRQTRSPLLTIKDADGRFVSRMPASAFDPDLTKLFTAHFGLTVLRASALKGLPKPWFWGRPAADGSWHEERPGIVGKTDPDISFWLAMEKAGLGVYSANRVIVGHLEAVVTWPDARFGPLYQYPTEYHKTGKPRGVRG